MAIATAFQVSDDFNTTRFNTLVSEINSNSVELQFGSASDSGKFLRLDSTGKIVAETVTTWGGGSY